MFFRICLSALILLACLLGISSFVAAELEEGTGLAVRPEGEGAVITTETVKNNTEMQGVQSSESSAKSSIQVLEFVLANKVEGREPSEIVENFNLENSKGMAYAFARLSTTQHTQVTFIWFKEGKEYSRFITNVEAAKKWRTYAAIKLRTGNWKVQLVSGNEVLVEQVFTVQ